MINLEKNGIKVLTGKEVNRYAFNEIEPSWFIDAKYLNAQDIERANKEKVVVQDIVAHILNPKPHIKLTATIDLNKQFCFNTVMCFAENSRGITNKIALILINSKFMSFYYYYFIFNQAIRTMHFMPGYSDLIPIPVDFVVSKKTLEEKADTMLAKNRELAQATKQLLHLLQSKFETLTISKKLEDWPLLSFREFLDELKKQKIKLSLSEEAEWLTYFEQQKANANSIEQMIHNTDKEIDAMVYALYGLTEEEIKIVEES